MPKALKEKMAEVIEDVSIDEFLRRDPALLTEQDFEAVVARLRTQYAQYVTAEEKKKAKKEGVTTTEEENDNDDDS